MASTPASQMKIKGIYLNDIRRLYLNINDYGILHLKSTIRTTFDLESNVTFQLQYEDDESDFVTIAKDGDLKDALECAVSEKRKSLRISIIPQQTHQTHAKSNENDDICTEQKTETKAKQLIQSLLTKQMTLPALNDDQMESVLKEIKDGDYAKIPMKEYGNKLQEKGDWLNVKNQQCFLCGKDQESGAGKVLRSMTRNNTFYTSYWRGTHMTKDRKHKIAHLSIELDLDAPHIELPALSKPNKAKLKQQQKKQELRQQQLDTRARYETLSSLNDGNSLNTQKKKLKQTTCVASAQVAAQNKAVKLQVHPSTIKEPKVNKVDVGSETDDDDIPSEEDAMEVHGVVSNDETQTSDLATEEDTEKKPMEVQGVVSNDDTQTSELSMEEDTEKKAMEVDGVVSNDETQTSEFAMDQDTQQTKDYGLPLLNSKRKRSNESDNENEPPKKRMKKKTKRKRPKTCGLCDGTCKRRIRKSWFFFCCKSDCDFDLCAR
eukprot:818725_1